MPFSETAVELISTNNHSIFLAMVIVIFIIAIVAKIITSFCKT